MTREIHRSRSRPGPRRPEGSPSGPDEVRRAVLDAAARLFAQRGVGEVSLRDIAKAADVHVSLISRYVGGRDALIRAVLNDLAGAIAQHTATEPLQQHSFDPDSPLGRWISILGYWMLTGRDAANAVGDVNPVLAMAEVISEHFGLEPRDARVRAAQIFGSALGWRLFEPYLLAAGELEDVPVSALHDELTAIHRVMGSLPLAREEASPGHTRK